MRWNIVIILGIFFNSCTCELPISEDKIQGQVDQKLDNLECQIQSRLRNATNIAFREMCNGIDDDCDTLIDEGLIDVVCLNDCESGVQSCIDAEWTTCTARQPSDEVCNMIDDDCDDEIDELPPRPALSDSCVSGIESCVHGTWECEVATPVMNCSAVDTHNIAGPFTHKNGYVHWSYALHPVDQPTESYDRRVSILTMGTDKLMHVRTYQLTSADDSFELWSFQDETFGTLEDMRIRAASLGSTTLIGLEKRQSLGYHGGSWLVHDAGQMSVHVVAKAFESPDVYGLVPILHEDVRLGVYQSTSAFLPPSGPILWQHVPKKPSLSLIHEFGFSRPFGHDARLYGENVWVAWRTVKNVIEYRKWSDDLDEPALQTTLTVDDIPIRDMSFVSSVIPRFIYYYPLFHETRVYSHVCGSEKEDSFFTFPLERRHVRAAVLADDLVLVSGAPDGKGMEYTYVDVPQLDWSHSLGTSQRVRDRNITVTSDLGGYSVFVLYDEDRFVKYAHVRCE